MAAPSVTEPFTLAGAALRVRDVAAVSAFYEAALGLDLLHQNSERVTLGADGAALLQLDAAPEAPQRQPGSAGLFHLAFLVDDRAALARVVNRLSGAGIRLSGASDHGVSEALYLDDPEGNGVEIYVDRAQDAWPRDKAGGLAMVTQPLDGSSLMATVERGANAAPLPLRLGHVHLEVGDVDKAAAFYAEAFAFEQMQRMPSAAFMAAGGYHHHLGLNSWRAAGAGPADPGALGLAEIWYRGGGPKAANEVRDPWGTCWRRAEAA